jgi:uncharacterized protein (DUF697 family)
MLSDSDKSTLLTVVLLASFADGAKSDAERVAVRRVIDSLGSGESGPNVWELYQSVLSQPPVLEDLASRLATRETKVLAYEMAVGVCDADGPPNAAESAFLSRLHAALGLTPESRVVERDALDVATAVVPAAAVTSTTPVVMAPGAPPARPAPSVPSAPLRPDNAELERVVLNHAILNGALELLPQSLATMAIVPIQMRMVYRIGVSHGYPLDRGHIRDFLATAGAGLAAQAVEGYARKLIGGLAGRLLGGGMVGALGRGALSAGSGAALTFAATWAIGQLAIRYYGGGRRMETAVLRETYTKLLADGQRLFGQHADAIQQRAATLNPADVITLARSGP